MPLICLSSSANPILDKLINLNPLNHTLFAVFRFVVNLVMIAVIFLVFTVVFILVFVVVLRFVFFVMFVLCLLQCLFYDLYLYYPLSNWISQSTLTPS